MRRSPVFRVRQRAHAILLSAKDYRIDQLVDIFEVDRDTITRWLDRWDEDRFDGLEDAPRSFAPALDSGRGRRLELFADPGGTLCLASPRSDD